MYCAQQRSGQDYSSIERSLCFEEIVYTYRSQGWNETPSELLELFMQKLEKQGGLDAVLAMRAVSKAWRAAFEGYAGTVTNSRRLMYVYKGREAYDWPRISSIQPHMAHLRISAYGTSTMSLQSYQSLQACSDLRSLSIAACGPKSHHYPVGLHLLPKSLAAITLVRVQMFKTFSMSCLTRVCLGGLRNEPSSVWQKLKKLTQLNVGLHS